MCQLDLKTEKVPLLSPVQGTLTNKGVSKPKTIVIASADEDWLN